jgi:hypothetical protein
MGNNEAGTDYASWRVRRVVRADYIREMIRLLSPFAVLVKVHRLATALNILEKEHKQQSTTQDVQELECSVLLLQPS